MGFKKICWLSFFRCFFLCNDFFEVKRELFGGNFAQFFENIGFFLRNVWVNLLFEHPPSISWDFSKDPLKAVLKRDESPPSHRDTAEIGFYILPHHPSKPSTCVLCRWWFLQGFYHGRSPWKTHHLVGSFSYFLPTTKQSQIRVMVSNHLQANLSQKTNLEAENDAFQKRNRSFLVGSMFRSNQPKKFSIRGNLWMQHPWWRVWQYSGSIKKGRMFLPGGFKYFLC